MKYDEFTEKDFSRKEHVWVARPRADASRNLPLVIEAAGSGRWTEKGTIDQESAPGYGIEYLCEGDMILIQDGREHMVKPGTVYLLQKGKSHSYRTGPSGYLTKSFLRLGGLGLDNVWRLLGLHEFDVPYLSDTSFFNPLFRQIMTLIQEESEDEGQTGMELSCRLYEMLMSVGQAMRPPIPPVLESSMEFMQKNLYRMLTREELCRHREVSMTHLNRLFTTYLGYSPMAYFMKLKYEWSAQLLRTTSMSVKEIAYETGFSDPLYFSSRFKKYTGFSPRNYRKNLSESE